MPDINSLKDGGSSESSVRTPQQSFVSKVASAWFEPKSFESERLYQILQVDEFKKWLPTGGDHVVRIGKRFGWQQLVNVNKEVDSLKGFEFHTKVYESIHLVGLSIMTQDHFSDFIHENYGGVAIGIGINTMFNLYPIMVQRYNRIRLQRAIRRFEHKKLNQ